MSLTKETYKLRSFVYLWTSPGEATLYPVEDKPNGFSSYVDCWQWIYDNGLQLHASACEQYVPITNQPKRSGLRQLMQRNGG